MYWALIVLIFGREPMQMGPYISQQECEMIQNTITSLEVPEGRSTRAMRCVHLHFVPNAPK